MSKLSRFRPAILATAMLALAACSQDAQAPVDSEVAPVNAQDDEQLSGGENSLADATNEGTTAQAQTIPESLRGQWREDDLGRAPTAEDCRQTSQTNRNFGKVLTVRADGYSLFESGGRIIEVHNRTDSMIDATFDTNYADTSTTARKDLALQPGGTLAVNNDDGDGIMDVVQYRRCPG